LTSAIGATTLRRLEPNFQHIARTAREPVALEAASASPQGFAPFRLADAASRRQSGVDELSRCVAIDGLFAAQGNLAPGLELVANSSKRLGKIAVLDKLSS
jgi:hypothetical protein